MNSNFTYDVQPNHILTTKYKFSKLEKNILYTVIEGLQSCMSRDIDKQFKVQYIKVKLSRLDDNGNYEQIRKAIKTLASKQVEYTTNEKRNGKTYVYNKQTSLISGLSILENSSIVEFIVPIEAQMYFTYIGGGFTKLQLTVALSLNSIYSKLMYELCCRWADQGGYSCSVQDLKKILKIENTYKHNGHFKSKVLEVSKKELMVKADLYFSYRLCKNGSKSFNSFSMIINKSSGVKNNNTVIRSADYEFAYSFLIRFFPPIDNNNALDYLKKLEQKNNLIDAVLRFRRLDKELVNGNKDKFSAKNLLEVAILPDFGINTQQSLKFNLGDG
ncbi:replication initiation protein [Olleya namhaensis]|uniref:replication initiation protein n=1 Tax=Olleya namhaensis TaxID=1144750 RepID=UPI00232F0A96|nr:replication initiation protein [Olleya namhaensis]